MKNPKFAVAVALQNETSAETFQNFVSAIENSESRFTPVLGLHNCPANLSLAAKGQFSEGTGSFTTKSFVTSEKHQLQNVSQTTNFRIGLDKIPTFQNDDFWNLPDKYENVVYPSENCEISVEGKHFKFTDGSNWVLL